MTYAEALRELAAQHATLRGMMDRCEQLADELDAGLGRPDGLLREVAKLRLAFDHHNQAEEKMLRPILKEADAFAEPRIERMIADHVSEHRSIGGRIHASPTSELREVIASLRAHLADEERYFLSARVLRDDLVTVEGGG